MTKNRRRSVDAHIHDGAGRVLLSVWPIKAANNSFMTEYNLSELWFPRTNQQKSLTFRWRSFSWWGREGVAICFAYKGGQEFLCDWLQPIVAVISQDTWPKIIDTHFPMAVSTICNHSFWHSPSFTLFWLPVWCFHILSSWSLRCSLIIYRYI